MEKAQPWRAAQVQRKVPGAELEAQRKGSRGGWGNSRRRHETSTKLCAPAPVEMEGAAEEDPIQEKGAVPGHLVPCRAGAT